MRRRARMVQVRAGHVGVHQHSDDEAGKGGLRQRLGKHQVGQRIALAAAVLALVHEAQQTGLAHAAQHIARHHAGLFPGGRVRLHFFGNEAGDLVAQQFVLGGFVDGGVHGESLKVSELFFAGKCAGERHLSAPRFQCGTTCRPRKTAITSKSASRCSSMWPWAMQ